MSNAAGSVVLSEAYWLLIHAYVHTRAFNKQLDFKTYPDEPPRIYLAE